jgi:hypothetical protein
METRGNIIYFESDNEFTDFCLAPYGVVVHPENSSSPYWTGVYSDEYKEAINEGMIFVIKDEDSVVFKHKCVTKRVPIQGTRREALVQMPVQNLEQYFEHF